jgi:hypothetical protein
MVGAVAVPAGAGKTPEEVLPTLEVEKIVVSDETSYDVSGLFSVQVACADFDEVQSADDDGFVATLTFNPDGSPHSAPGGWVDTGTSWSLQGWDLKRVTCTVTEQAGGGATNLVEGSPTYTCSFANEKWEDEAALEQLEEGPEPGCLSTDGSDPAVVRFGSPWDRSCQTDESISAGEGCYCVQSALVTITNEIAQDPAKVSSGEVVVTPKFAG